ncbi:MAG TPA: UDP-3-O-(3-hydroxymyristoyl)glucosamine N-acyltransferase, partial [Nitrospirae bacterium]|nr:UDP-3-O-(3-hydroxymyristoyl)glucosamine N-acyltransferase [Nitrospirota bacterium]
MKTGELAKLLSAELSGSSEEEISSVRGVSDASEGSLTFLTGKKYISEIAESAASAVLVEKFYDRFESKIQLKVPNPVFAFARALELFYIKKETPKGIMKGALVENGANIEEKSSVYPNAYICSGAEIGEGTVIFPNVYLGKGARTGRNCVIYPGVVIRENVMIGNDVIIHANAVIGSDGFGYVPEAGRHYKIPQVGAVKIGDNVEIGAGVTIDRATTGTTSIGDGTKIDNLVQIGHNVRIGRHCILVAQVAIGGSTVIGDYVVLGGQVGVADHASIESGCMVGAKSGIMGTLKKGI